MRGKSHSCLGKYLVQQYMEGISGTGRRAFLIGCIQPDRNPATYLKGSFRHQWLRGHNFRNAKRYMDRISLRLERKGAWNLFDYYTLGKLIHYTADAFTYTHNDRFCADLAKHLEYETALQTYFLAYMQDVSKPEPASARSVMEEVCRVHREYRSSPAGIPTDTQFALRACCCVLSVLQEKTAAPA